MNKKRTTVGHRVSAGARDFGRWLCNCVGTIAVAAGTCGAGMLLSGKGFPAFDPKKDTSPVKRRTLSDDIREYRERLPPDKRRELDDFLAGRPTRNLKLELFEAGQYLPKTDEEYRSLFKQSEWEKRRRGK